MGKWELRAERNYERAGLVFFPSGVGGYESRNSRSARMGRGLGGADGAFENDGNLGKGEFLETG